MKKIAKIMLTVVIVLVFVAPIAFSSDVPFSGFLGDPTVYDLLKPGPEGGAKLRWLKPDVDFKKYNKFMVDGVIFFLADKSEYKGIDPQEMKELADEFNKELAAALEGKYPIVAEPGPDVARIRFAITNIRPSKPGISAVTSIVPIGLGVSIIKKGASGGWSGSGETAIELMVLDTMTNEVIALAVDQQTAAFSHRFSAWGSARDAFKFWSERMVMFVDNTKGIEREPKK